MPISHHLELWHRLRWMTFAVGALQASCSAEPRVLPPLGEALVVVDTDAPVPELAARLRVDVYADDGTWLDSRDLPMRDAEDWPGSFSVYMDEGSSERTVLVRARTYPDGRVRDYLGERFFPAPALTDPAAPVEPPPGNGEPRLVRDGVDVTPPTEPTPELTIDRLVRLRLEDGERRSTVVTLRGACTGTMADVAGRSTCIDTEGARAHAPVAAVSTDMTVPSGSGQIDTFAAPTPCTLPPRTAGAAFDGTPLHDEEICVPGGMLFLGSQDFAVAGGVQTAASGLAVGSAVPVRFAVIPPLLVDRYEVTVARWRKALAEGFVPPAPFGETPLVNDGPIEEGFDSANDLCTWSPEPLGREELAVSCVHWPAARAFCQFHGGDLLTEARWEYVATATRPGEKSRYPWGDETPSCDRSVYGRFEPGSFVGSAECSASGFGPAPVWENVTSDGQGDVTPLGIGALGGGMSEWTLDSLQGFGSQCWYAASLFDPRCWEDDPAFHVVRGGSWLTYGDAMAPTRRYGVPRDRSAPHVGFRCAREGS